MNDTHGTRQPTNIDAIRKSNKQKLVWGLICLIGPTALIVVSLILYAIVNFIFASTVTPDSVMPCPSVSESSESITNLPCPVENIDQSGATGAGGPINVIANVALFIVGAIATLTWLPGIIGGIVLLATRTRVAPRR